MAQVKVTSERLVPAEVVVEIDGQERYTGVSENGATAAQVLDEITRAAGLGRLVRQLDDSTLVLDEEIFILRNGEQLAPTTDPDTQIMPGDAVVVNRKFNNG